MKLFEEYKLYEDLWEADKKVTGIRGAAVTDADFQWDEAAIVDDFKRAATAYINGANLEDALRDIKVMIISGACAKLDPADTKGLFRQEFEKYGLTRQED